MIWYVAVGSAIGGVARYAVGGGVQRMFGDGFPAGTLLVNFTGALLLGFVMRWFLENPALSPEMRAFLTIGLCGGYTTFSAFAYETVQMIGRDEWTLAILSMAANVMLSLLAIVTGSMIAAGLVATLRGA